MNDDEYQNSEPHLSDLALHLSDNLHHPSAPPEIARIENLEQLQAHLDRQIAYHSDMIRYHQQFRAALKHVKQEVAEHNVPMTDVRDDQWERVEPLLSLETGRGRPYLNTRRTLNGVIYVLTTHCGWGNMPQRYGSYVTCWRRYTRWQSAGIWKRVQTLLGLTDLYATPS